MSRKTFFAVRVGLLLGFGLTLSVGADDTALERSGYALTTLDGSGNVGRFSSVTIGADGLGLISSFDATNADLKVAHCSNLACTSATRTTLTFLKSEDNDGQFTSVTSAGGRGVISYYDSTDQVLKLALCPDLACTEATITTTPDRAGNVGQYSSVTIGTDGLALISYYDATNGDLKVAHCSDSACTAATRTTLQSEDNVGQYSSVTIGTDGLGLISYYDATSGDLKVAHCSDLACTAATLTTLDREANVGQYSSVTIGTDGLGLISYYDATSGDLKVAHCSNLVCNAYHRRRVESGHYVGKDRNG